MDFKCPHCDLNLKCDDDLAGQVVRCPSCEGKLQVPDLTPEQPSLPPPPSGTLGKGTKAVSKKPSRHPPPPTGSADPAKRSPSEPVAGKGAWQPTDSSNVSTSVSFGFGALFAFVYCLLLYPIRNLYFGALFWKRGWVPFVMVLLMGWSFAVLAMKFRKLRKQKRAMLLDVLPDSIGAEITIQNVSQFRAHVAALPVALQECLLVKRIQLGLQHFDVRHSNPEVASMMTKQSDIDAGTIISSYSLLKVFLWAIPILGFIGTVIGISGAVAGFSSSLDAAQDIEVLKASLGEVTTGLAVAFDTTLVGLVMSIFVSFPLNALQKAEEDLLGWVDAYCNENLLKRLNDAGGLAGGGGDAESVIQSIAQALAHSQQGILGQFQQVQEHMSQVQEGQLAMLQRMAEAVDQQLGQMEHRARVHQEELSTALSEIVNPIQKAMLELKKHGRTVESEAADMIAQSGEAVRAHIAALAEGLGGLNDVLAKLGEKQVVIEHTGTRRGWLWFLPRRKRQPEKRR